MTFTDFCSHLILDTDEPFTVEPFQQAFIDDVASGIPECWLILPEGNGKTTLIAALVLYHARTTRFASVPVAASTRDQAMLLYRSAKNMILRSELDDYVCNDGYRRIRHGESFIQIFAADAGGGDGVMPTLCVIDEAHRHRSMDLYLTWSGKLHKRQGQLVLISTAGVPGSEFETIREGIRQSASSVTRTPGYGRYSASGVVLHEYAIPEDGDVEDLALVKRANPLSTITVDTLRAKRTKPTMTVPHWTQFTCNRPTRSILAAITEAEWLAAKGEPIPPGEPISLGADFGWKHDPTALVPFLPGTPHRLGPATIIEPPSNGDMTALEDVLIAIEAVHQVNPIHTCVMDLTGARDVANWIETELGATVIDRGTNLTAQVTDFDAFMQALRGGTLTHAGDYGLTRHALNAIARQLPRGDYVFERPVTSRTAKGQELRRIDALVAAAMVHSVMAVSHSASVYDGRGLIVV